MKRRISNINLPVLKTPELVLRPPETNDAADLYSILGDAETVKYWSIPPITSLEEARKILSRDIESCANGDGLSWAISLKNTDRMIGRCALFHLDQANQRAEIGFILNRGYWRRGLMKQALAAMIDYGFHSVGLHRLEADVDPDNMACLGLLDKLGFEREGVFHDRWLVDGHWHDSVMLGLVKP